VAVANSNDSNMRHACLGGDTHAILLTGRSGANSRHRTPRKSVMPGKSRKTPEFLSNLTPPFALVCGGMNFDTTVTRDEFPATAHNKCAGSVRGHRLGASRAYSKPADGA